LKGLTKQRAAITVAAGALILIRKVAPGLLDLADLIIVAVALLPWLTGLIKKAELPGGIKIEFQEVQQAVAKATAGDRGGDSVGERVAIYPDPLASHRQIFEHDPNLALVGLRIEIEKRLRAIAEREGLRTDRSLGSLFDQLRNRGTLTGPTLSGVRELIMFGNSAAHGAQVERAAAEWALDYAPEVLRVLDRALEGAAAQASEQ
jgi:hypothetical protein